MKKWTLTRYTKLTGEQMGEFIERFVAGEDLQELAKEYDVYFVTAKNYIHKYYHGIIPKERQHRITLQSAINEQL